MPPTPGNDVRRRSVCTLLVIIVSLHPVVGFNVTTFLSSIPELSSFNHLLSATGVADDLAQRSSLTILAVPNHIFDPFLASSRLGSLPSSQISDVLRYHILLQYLDWPALRQIPAAGKLVTTLFQTTGRAVANLGAVNLTRDPLTGNVALRPPGPSGASNATVVSLVRALPYVAAVFTVDGLLVPAGFDPSASVSGPPVPINITRVLIDAKDFNVVGSMLAASGVTAEIEADERGAGITAFLPTDEAFASLSGRRIQSLPADQKAVVLKYHALHSYYPLGSLQSIVNPVQPTLATEEQGAGSFTLNIARTNGSLSINTGIAAASITQTVFDQNPVAIFGISAVLLPREIFGPERIDQTGGDGPQPESSPAPELSPDSPDSGIPPSSAAPPPGSGVSGGSGSGGGGEGRGLRLAGILGVLGFCWVGL
ncbi:Fasciclin-like arabinogalactan protein 4 [Nymphaea thermarum]|nr:Fasciclin-like arabinogalactan protein 4 [Nymphaea thermarum]